MTTVRLCKAQQTLSIIPPKHSAAAAALRWQPFRCALELYRLANGQKEGATSVESSAGGSRLRSNPISSWASAAFSCMMDQFAHAAPTLPQTVSVKYLLWKQLTKCCFPKNSPHSIHREALIAISQTVFRKTHQNKFSRSL